MDFWDESPVHDHREVETFSKTKKTVTIDDKRDIKFINIEREPSKVKSPFLENVDLYVWPWRIAVATFLIGYLFHVLSYATPYWMIPMDANGNDVMLVGMWSACTTISNCSFRGTPSNCTNAVRTFGGIGILCGIAVIILLVIQFKRPSSRGCINRAVVITCFVSALSVQICASVFWRTGACYHNDSSSYSSVRWAWSLALSYTSVLIMIVTALLFLVIELITISRQRGHTKQAWNGRGFFIT